MNKLKCLNFPNFPNKVIEWFSGDQSVYAAVQIPPGLNKSLKNQGVASNSPVRLVSKICLGNVESI